MSWISESAQRGSDLRKHYKMYDIEIFIKDPLPNDIDADFIFKYIASVLPAYLMTEIDIVYVGDFEDLRKRNANAVFVDGAIFVTNDQSSEMDLIDDIIHEIAHSIEKKYVDHIYGDGAIEREFKRKRKQLYDVLKAKGKNPPAELVTNINFSQTIDDYFFNKFLNVSQIDDCIISTETPAWAIDRLSILELKIYHMNVEANRTLAGKKHRLSCLNKLEVLKSQRENLSVAIDQLIENISNGKTKALTYKQMKMYNDEKLNPELYKK